MNKNILDELMKLNGINSYLKLSQKIDIPYTTLLDLINGKGEKLSNIKIISNYFNVSLSNLVEDKKYYIIIDEKDNIKVKLETDYTSFASILILND